ncbi:hypothetical protein H5410_061211 [Solanum commersonii]|uniref:Uncharacterized protein n=1 Tax=Solanum commersonii TaxID=4109 RepID=A0A9J5W747_SOLCO|nr:hypothetical protein H5410_061211 [Solanum commersonii]
MLKFHSNKRWHFCYGTLLTRYFCAQDTVKEAHDVCPPRAPHLVCLLVDVTNTKAQDASHGPVLSVTDRQAKDDCLLG